MKAALVPVLCVWANLPRAANESCNFEVVSIDDIERGGIEWASALLSPVVIKQAFAQVEKSYFLNMFGNETLAITSHLERQSQTGQKTEYVQTTIREWTDSWVGNDSIRYAFSFLQEFPQTGLDRRLSQVGLVPNYLRHVGLLRFLVIGSQSNGIALHRHSLTWLGLMAGKKLWFAVPPTAVIPAGFYGSHRTPEELGDLQGVQSCYQDSADIVILPSKWWHATFDIADWTVGYGSQAIYPDPPVELLDLFYAASTGDVDALEGSAVVEVSSEAFEMLLRECASSGHVKGAEFLLRIKASTLEAALHQTAFRGHADVVNLLLANRANIKDQQVPIFLSERGNVEILQTYIRRLRHVERVDTAYSPTLETHLSYAAQNGHVENVDLLVAEGAIVDFRPLHFAVHHGYSLVVSRLLEHRADPLAKDERGRTPFEVASEAGHTRVLDALSPKARGLFAQAEL